MKRLTTRVRTRVPYTCTYLVRYSSTITIGYLSIGYCNTSSCLPLVPFEVPLVAWYSCTCVLP
jgi:hypothetical protein